MRKFIIYRIYYGSNIIYVGRTKQPLQSRIRGHMFKKPMHRLVDINHVTKIDYAELGSEADMFLYEIYYINTIKPPLNVDDKADDNLSATLPELEFKDFWPKNFDKWKTELNAKYMGGDGKGEYWWI